MAVIEEMKSFERNEGSQELEGWFCNGVMGVGGGGRVGKFSKSL